MPLPAVRPAQRPPLKIRPSPRPGANWKPTGSNSKILSKDEKRLKATITQYENRLNQTPVREQQQAEIVRDTEVMRLEYGDLLKKEQESQLATNLEKQQGGQQFRLVDAASLPQVPSSPKRVKIILARLGGWCRPGIRLALFMEFKDTALYTEKELAHYVAAPLAVTIPLLPTPQGGRSGRNGKVSWNWWPDRPGPGGLARSGVCI